MNESPVAPVQPVPFPYAVPYAHDNGIPCFRPLPAALREETESPEHGVDVVTICEVWSDRDALLLADADLRTTHPLNVHHSRDKRAWYRQGTKTLVPAHGAGRRVKDDETALNLLVRPAEIRAWTQRARLEDKIKQLAADGRRNRKHGAALLKDADLCDKLLAEAKRDLRALPRRNGGAS